MLGGSLLEGDKDHLLNQARSELMKQEHQVGSLNSCINELQQQAHVQRQSQIFFESRREQSRLQMRNVYEMGDMKRTQELQVDEFFAQDWKKVMRHHKGSLHKCRKCKKRWILWMIQGNFKKLGRIPVGGRLTFPVNQQRFQVLVLCWAATIDPRNTSESQENVFGNHFSSFDPSQNHHQEIHQCRKPTSDWDRDLFRKRWRANWGHNSNADICKKTVDHEFIISGGYSAFYGWTAKTADVGTAIRQVLCTFLISLLED